MTRRDLLGGLLGAAAARGQSGAAAGEPLYLLTYDHGGLVLWGIDHFRKYLQSAVEWLDRYPSFKIGLDNEAFTYDYMSGKAPDLLEEIRVLLRKYKGRFGIGTCTYGQPLIQFVNEESNIRQIGYALEADRRLLGVAPPLYIMSEHAMHSQIPQIAAGFGFAGAIMRTHYMMYGYNPTFDAPIGWWVGADGSRIAAIPTYKGEGAEFGKTTVDTWMLTRYPSNESKVSPADFRKQFERIQPLLASRADDSGLRREELVREIEGKPGFRWALLEDILPNFPKPEAEFRTAPNDFVTRMPWGYCGNEIWDTSRRAEVSVLTAERLAAAELLTGGENREAALRESWRNLLVAQHHDIQICGLLDEAHKYLPESLDASAQVAGLSLFHFAQHMKGGQHGQITVFNPHSWPRREWIVVDVSEATRPELDLAVRRDGKRSPALRLQEDTGPSRMALLAEAPPLGLASYELRWGRGSSSNAEVRVRELEIRTGSVNIALHPEGGIQSISDKAGRLLVTRALFAGRIEGKPEESKGAWRIECHGPFAKAVEVGRIGGIPYRLELAACADSARIDLRVKFQFEGQRIGVLSDNKRDARSAFIHEEKLRFKMFPAFGAGAVGIRDLPFVIAETGERYVEGNYWTALSDGQAGVAVFNRGAMGSVREQDGSFSVPLAHAMFYIWNTRMLTGEFEYEFALYPFAGDWRAAGLHRRALEYNVPLVASYSPAGDGSLGSELKLLAADSPDVLATAVYSEGGKTHVRLWEHSGRGARAELRYLRGKARLTEVDLAGRALGPAEGSLDFRPWQFRTIRLEVI